LTKAPADAVARWHLFDSLLIEVYPVVLMQFGILAAAEVAIAGFKVLLAFLSPSPEAVLAKTADRHDMVVNEIPPGWYRLEWKTVQSTMVHGNGHDVILPLIEFGF
jgi:hypothetical protein